MGGGTSFTVNNSAGNDSDVVGVNGSVQAVLGPTLTFYNGGAGSTVVDVGPEATEMTAAGVLILFAEPLPDALAEVSVVHRPSQTLEGHSISAGDVVRIGDSEVEITSVGDLATKNLDELGHVVLYINQADQKLLPGAVNAQGTLPDVEAGQVIEFRTPS